VSAERVGGRRAWAVDVTDATAVDSVKPRSGRRRPILAGVALIFACLAILLATVAVWAHQVAFNTERFTALTVGVMAEPELIDPMSALISAQVVAALDVQGRIEARLPGPTKALAPALTVSIRDAIDKRLQVALTNPKIQAALVKTLSFTHARIMNLLRDKSDAASVADGYVQIEIFPVVGAALDELQANGLIPPEVQLPDLSSPEAPGVLAQRLESALGVTLPADFGTIRLMPADRLLAARSFVRVFDIVVVGLVILSVVFIALALGLARQRRRMIIYLGVGTLIAFLLGRFAIRGIEGALISGITDVGLAGGVRSVFDATLEDLRRVTSLVLVATVIIGVAAYLWGRPSWFGAVTTRGKAAASATASATASASASATASAGSSLAAAGGVSGVVREHRSAVQMIGLGIVAFIVVWLAIGLEIALLGLALVVGFELVLRALASPGDGEPSADPADGAPTSET